jgi:putative membrane protein
MIDTRLALWGRRREMVLQSLAGLPAFLGSFCTACVVAAAIICLGVYALTTPHDAFARVGANAPDAAIVPGLSLLGRASVIAHRQNLVGCVIWSRGALIVRIMVYFVVRTAISNLPKRVAAGDRAPAVWLRLAFRAAGALGAISH